MIFKLRSYSIIRKLSLTAIILVGIIHNGHASETTDQLLPDDSTFNFEYLGAFRFPIKVFGSSRMSYPNGSFTLSPNGKTIFVAGHDHYQSIAEFLIPELRLTKNPSELLIAANVQPFHPFLRNTKRLENPQKLDRISGMEVIEGELFVNALEFYDAPADNTHTTFIVRDAYNLASAKVDGFFTLKGRAHSAGWMSKLPKKWQEIFSATYLNGYAPNHAINSRLSMGPSAFVSNLDIFAGVDEPRGLIPTTKLMDFSVKHPIHKDVYNKSGNNKVWTEISEAFYGFILPNNDFYFVIGNSGGHESKIGYKATQTNGNKCGGPCAFDPKDYYNFYWIFDVNDFVAVKNGKKKSYELLPINYGKLQLPFAPSNKTRNIVGADFNENSETLYIMLKDVDHTQSQFERAPVMLAYKIKL